MNTTYSGKGRPRLTDVGQKPSIKSYKAGHINVMQAGKSAERDYDRELINSTKRAKLGEEFDEEADVWGVVMVVALTAFFGYLIIRTLFW